MTVAYVFCGPSLERSSIERAVAAASVRVVLLPPARQGDILRLLGEEPAVIGLIDGFFFQQPAVHFKEILLALESGIAVLGGASMGALRAAELSAYGMEGIGEVYAMYADGRLEGDDEVAVLHAGADHDYRAMSEAMVNIRVNVRRAQQRRILDAVTANAIVNVAKGLHFTERTFDAVLSRLDLSDGGRPECRVPPGFREFIANNRIDQKHDDSVALIHTMIRRAETHDSPRPGAAFRTSRTSYLRTFERLYVGRWYGDTYIADYRVWSLKKLLAPDFETKWVQLGRRCLAIDEAQVRGFDSPADRALLDEFRNEYDLPTESMLDDWLDSHCMRVAELSLWLRERWFETALAQWHADHVKAMPVRGSFANWLTATVAGRLGVRTGDILDRIVVRPGLIWEEPMIREDKARGSFAQSAEDALEVYAYNKRVEREAPGVLSRLADVGLQTWFASRWGVPAEEMGAAVRRRGFDTMRAFLDVARIGFLFNALGGKPLVEHERDPR